MIEQAIKYGALGLKVFPVIGKIPALVGWKDKATSNADEIRELFKIKHTGIGLATGKKSAIPAVLIVNINYCNA